MDRMVVSSDRCSNPVPPSIVNRDNSDMSEDDEKILSDLACYVCDNRNVTEGMCVFGPEKKARPLPNWARGRDIKVEMGYRVH